MDIVQLGREYCINQRKPTIKRIHLKIDTLDDSKITTKTNSGATEDTLYNLEQMMQWKPDAVKPAGLKSASCP